MNITDILPYIISIATLIVGWVGGRRKSSAEVESIKADTSKKLLTDYDQFIVKPLQSQVANLLAEVQRLNILIESISECPNNQNCPIRKNKHQKK